MRAGDVVAGEELPGSGVCVRASLEPDGGAAQSLCYRYRRACCGPKALPLGLRDREVAAPSLSYREPPSTRSVVVYIGGVATLEKAPLSAKSRLPQVGIGTSCPWRVCAHGQCHPARAPAHMHV